MNKNIIRTILGVAMMIFGAVCILAVFLPWISASIMGISVSAGFFSASSNVASSSMLGKPDFSIVWPILLIAGGTISLIGGALYGFVKSLKPALTASIALLGGLTSLGTAIAFSIWFNGQLNEAVDTSSSYELDYYSSTIASMVKSMVSLGVGYILTLIFAILGTIASIAGIIVGAIAKNSNPAPVVATAIPVAPVAPVSPVSPVASPAEPTTPAPAAPVLSAEPTAAPVDSAAPTITTPTETTQTAPTVTPKDPGTPEAPSAPLM